MDAFDFRSVLAGLGIASLTPSPVGALKWRGAVASIDWRTSNSLTAAAAQNRALRRRNAEQFLPKIRWKLFQETHFPIKHTLDATPKRSWQHIRVSFSERALYSARYEEFYFSIVFPLPPSNMGLVDCCL